MGETKIKTSEQESLSTERLLGFDKITRKYFSVLDNMEKALFGNDNTITKEIIEKLTKENTGMYEKLEPYADMGTKYLEFKKIIATKIRRINRLIEERKIKNGKESPVDITAPKAIQNEPRQESEIELPKLKKFVDGLIDEELAKINVGLEKIENKNDPRMIEFLNNKKTLLETNPIEYFTREKEKNQIQLDDIVNNKTYTKEQKEDRGDILKYKMKELHRAIIGLKELSGKKGKTQAEMLKEKITAQIDAGEKKSEPDVMKEPLPKPEKNKSWWKKLFSKN